MLYVQRTAPPTPIAPIRVIALRSLAVLVLGLFVAAGCDRSQNSGAAADDRPNIVLITLDTTRADHLGTYGYFRDTSPEFDAFAAQSLTFDRMVAPIATTLPSHLSILTSSHPLEHGVLANTTQGGQRFVPAPELVSFAMVAHQAGYQTGAFVSAAPLKRGSGIEVGFDAYDQPEDKQRAGQQTADAAIAWLESLDDDRPYFLWVHFYDAHFPFVPPPGYRGRFELDGQLEAFIAERKIHETAPRALVGIFDTARVTTNDYDAELAYQDAQLGRVLRALESHGGGAAWQRTSVVVTADHGEGLCQHGEAAHGGTWMEQLHVPLLMRIPGATPRRIDTLLTASDVLPTLLGQLQVPDFGVFLDKALGYDVLAADFEALPVLSQDTGRERDEPFKYALTADGFKYFRVEGPDGVEEWLFHLEIDPHELRNVAQTHTEVLVAMRERTLGLIAERSERGTRLRAGVAAVAEGEVDPEFKRELCALGYLDSESCAEPDDDGAGGDDEASSGDS